MSLLSLPAELLHRICTFCDAPDRAKLRLACRLTQDVADEHFMKRIVAHYVRQDFDMLEQLTLNPRIARGVTQIYFHADRHHALSFEKWNQARKDLVRELRWPGDPELSCVADCENREHRLRNRNWARETNCLMNGYSKTELGDMFLKWSNLIMDECSLMEKHRQQECFETLFQRCPRLQSVVLSMRDDDLELSWQAVKELREVMLAPLGDPHSDRPGFRPLHELLSAMHETGKELKRLDVKTVSHQFFEPSPDTEVYHDAISRVQQLHIGINDTDLDRDRSDEDEGWLEDQQYDGLEDEAIDALIDARIEARREDPDQAHRRVVRSFEDGVFAAFLAAATKLTALSIVMPRERKFSPEAVALKDIVGDMHWPHLTKLALSNFWCRDTELVEFLQRHGDTIQNLVLCNVTFTEGSAQSCFEAIAGQFPLLRDVVLRGRFKADGVSSAQEGDLYLSGESSDIPYVERADARTQALQKYLIECGQFPIWILEASRTRMFWWYRHPQTRSEMLWIRQDNVDAGSEESESKSQADSEDSENPWPFR